MLRLDDVLAAAVTGDPLLRLYAAVAGRYGPWPAHPAYPGGTIAVPLTALAGADGRYRHDLTERWAEFLVRPLVTVFRTALDRLGVVIDTDPDAVAVELAPSGRLTGRVVVTRHPAGDADRAARDLARCLDLIAASLAGDARRSHVWRIAGEELIPTFERASRPAVAAVLSHATSIAELPLAELRTRPVLAGHAVHLSRAGSTALVDRLVDEALSAARETAARAVRGPGASTLSLVHRVLGGKQFRRGARGTYPPEVAERDMRRYVERGEPIRAVLPAFPIKQADSGLKALGTLPDLAELGLLVRLRELAAAVAAVYPPGLRITVLTDGNHFRIRPREVTAPYRGHLSSYLRLVGAEGVVEFRDIDEAAAEQLGPAVVRARDDLVAGHRAALADAYRDLDITRDPAGTLASSRALDPAGPNTPGPTVAEIFRSLVHSVPIPSGAVDPRILYADLHHLGPSVPPEITRARRAILGAAWAAALHYVSVARTDHDLGYDRMFWPRVRLTLSIPLPGRFGFAGLGGSAVLPWQGTGAVDQRGHVSTDFAVHLRDQAFVPVYSPLLGDAQPFFMAPITMVEPLDRPGSARLTPSFLERIRLRRR